jgi:hypothetical protein
MQLLEKWLDTRVVSGDVIYIHQIKKDEQYFLFEIQLVGKKGDLVDTFQISNVDYNNVFTALKLMVKKHSWNVSITPMLLLHDEALIGFNAWA